MPTWPTGSSQATPSTGGSYEAKEWAYYAVAAMMAAQPGRARRDDEADSETADAAATTDQHRDKPTPRSGRFRPNLGVSLARAVARGATGERVIAQDSAEKRLHLLTRQGLAGLHRHLPATVRHLRSAQRTDRLGRPDP